MAGSGRDRDLQAEIRRLRRQRALGDHAVCARCGEKDPLVLRRRRGGTVLCLRCLALERAPRIPVRPLAPFELPPFRRWCSACNFHAPDDVDDRGLFEEHHVGGRAHSRLAVVWLCLNCHAKVSERQRTYGVDLRFQGTRVQRAVHAAVSSGGLLIVSGEHAQKQGLGFWPGLREVAPNFLAGTVAVLEAWILDPEEDES